MSPDSVAAALLLAAGRSTRMGGGPRKVFLELAGRTVLERSAAAFDASRLVRAIVVVAHGEDLERVRALVRGGGAFAKVVAVVEGGAERADSVARGLAAVPAECALVAIHDAARPLVRTETIERCLFAAAERGGALVAVPCSDTVKQSDDGATSARTLDRARLWLAQTPQAFRVAQHKELLTRAAREGLSPTDDAALFERYVGPCALVEGERANLKITTREDLALAEALLRARGEERR